MFDNVCVSVRAHVLLLMPVLSVLAAIHATTRARRVKSIHTACTNRMIDYMVRCRRRRGEDS